jgi:hypothetical protein
MVVAAVGIGTAVAGAVGTSVASSNAADATKSAANQATQDQQMAINQQNYALQQQAALSAPYRNLGESAIPALQSLQGIGTPGANGQPSTAQMQQTLQNMPGYQFQQQQGTQGAVNAASAMGLGLSGNTLQSLSQFNQGLASTNYQQYLGNLFNTVGLGQAAAAGQSANIGNAAANIGNAYGAMGNIAVNQGNTMAGISANEAAGLTKSFGNAANSAVLGQTLNALNSPNGQDIYNLGGGGQASPGAGAGTVSAGDGYTLSGFGGP